MEVAYVTIGNAAFYLSLYVTGVHFRDELQHLVLWVSKKLSVDQSELDSWCQIVRQTIYMRKTDNLSYFINFFIDML